jgi:hypothetical protein
MTGHSMNLSKLIPSKVPGMTEAMRKGGKKGEKLFESQNVTKIYKIAIWIVVATVLTVAVLSAVLTFGKTMNWNILALHTVKMTTAAGEYIFSVLDYIAIVSFVVFIQFMMNFKVFILLWISILGHQEFGNLKRSDWQRFSH